MGFYLNKKALIKMEGAKRKNRRRDKNPIPYSMRKNPYLNHPKLSEGQKKFLGSICTVYSTENMKRGIEEQYVRQLIIEKEKGITSSISDNDFFKYLDYFCQSSKRKQLFNAPPQIRSDRRRSGIDENKPVPPSSNFSKKKGSLASSTTNSRSSPSSSCKEKFEQNPVDAEITVIGETTSESCVSSNNQSDEEPEDIPEVVAEEQPTTPTTKNQDGSSVVAECQDAEEVIPKTPAAESQTSSISGEKEVFETQKIDNNSVNQDKVVDSEKVVDHSSDTNENIIDEKLKEADTVLKTEGNDESEIEQEDSVFEEEKNSQEKPDNISLGEPTTNLLNLLESPTTKTAQE